MRILVYEFVTGGGWYTVGSGESFSPSLLAEGAAMAQALVADLSRIDGITVDALRDSRLAQVDFPAATMHEIGSTADEQAALARLSAMADGVILIAPEFAGHLARRAKLVEQAGGRLLGPSSKLVALAADKHALAAHLAAHAVPVPYGVHLSCGAPLPRDFPYPAVLKPRDGAGSLGVERITQWFEFSRTPGNDTHGMRSTGGWRLEQFCPGLPASVACLCGPGECLDLAPCRQALASDGRFTYLGGSAPLSGNIAERARKLAGRAVRSLGQAIGYIGVDLILGADEAGREDFVIEINPRFTTSYVGLRRLAEGNLAEALLAIALGRRGKVGWHEGEVTFDATGRVEFRPPISAECKRPLSNQANPRADEPAEPSSV